MLAFRIFQDSALKLRAVPEDEEGIDIDYLRTQLEESEAHARTASGRDQVSSCKRELQSCLDAYQALAQAPPPTKDP